MRRGPSTPERRQAARSLVLSSGLPGGLPGGSGLAGRIHRLAQLLSPVDDGGWSRGGEPLDHSREIRALLEAATRNAAARRYVAAVEAYEAAEKLYEISAPTIREKRSRALAQHAVEIDYRRRTDLPQRAADGKRRKAARRAKGWIRLGLELRDRHKEWSVSSIIAEICRKRKRLRLGPRQMRRHLNAAGVK